MENEDDFPFQAEYAKSGRASCKKCKEKIEKDVLRLAALIQSPVYDGKMAQWYHFKCFFMKMRPKSVGVIAQFDSLRWEDQQKIKKKIEELGSGAAEPSSGKKGGKKGKKAGSDFSVEYAKSGKAACNYCEEKILKDQVRISKLDYESDKARRFGPLPRWHHVPCFADRREELEFYEAGPDLPGFNTLSADDKKMLREKIKKITPKRKAEDEPDNLAKKVKHEVEEKKSDDKMQKQNSKIFAHRDKLKRLTKAELISLLEHNFYFYPGGESKALDLLSDFMTFGVPKNCPLCKNGNFVYKYGRGYVCSGSISEWTNCTKVIDVPEREVFKIPPELKEDYSFLKSFKFKDYGPRLFNKIEKVPSIPEGNGRSSSSSDQPLEGMTFVVVGKKFTQSSKKIKEKIVSLGGKVATSVNKNTAAVITTLDTMGGTNKVIDDAKSCDVQCVSEDYLEEVGKGSALLMIEKKNIASWGSNPENRIFNKKSKSWASSMKSSKDSQYTKNLPEKMKIKLKGGAAVDPDSKLDDVAHVFKYKGKYYNSVLGYVNLSKGTNSYYKMQIIEGDKNQSWHLFRSWGRIGTTIGGNKLEEFEDSQDALRAFNSLYEEKAGRPFTSESREKLPGYWYPLEIDYGQDDNISMKLDAKTSKSALNISVKNLISLIFDIERMKSTLVEFEIDLKKMPLGKISRRQLENAYKALSNALEWLEKKPTEGDDVNAHLLDCSNQFYSLIPHDCGMKQPPILNNEDLIKNKIEMIDSMREIELAYNLLKSEGDGDVKEEDPFDQHYKKLKTDIQPLDKTSEEYKMIETYTRNTHATTHSLYTLHIEEIFKIQRRGEKTRFKPFKKLPNHKLLWHGSRLTNFAGILSQGLRIAPPEAPSTGYMFGKGVYFADMVSKSANYCCTSAVNDTGLLLLCDVALGNMYELKHSEYVTKLPKGKHSTKGLGRNCPDPSKTITIEDNIEVPLGGEFKADVDNTSLLYNEYIVYDVSQINSKYLIQTRFDYKY